MVKEHVQQWLSVEVWRLPEWYTRAEIAKNIGVRKSPTLIKVLGEMVEEGTLVSWRTTDDHKRPTIKYKISDSYREDQLQEALDNVGT